MLPTIVFGLALTFSIFYVASFIANIISPDYRKSDVWDVLFLVGTIVFWTWLYWLSH